MTKLALLGALATALPSTGCSQHVFSPPAQAFSGNGIRSLDDGQRAVDLEVSRHAEIFDPDILSGGARFRTGIGDHSEASLEGSVYGVEDGGPSKADRRIYAGRAGVRTNPKAGPFAIFGGIGGGYAPSGGSFVTADGGISVGYVNCYVTPMASASAFVSNPVGARPVDVSESDDHMAVTSTARFTVGSVIRVGLRIAMSPSRCRAGKQIPWLTTGIDVTTMVDRTSDSTLGGLGLGLEIPL